MAEIIPDFKVIYPNQILVSTNIPVTTAAYVLGTTYALGAKVYDAATKKDYESLKDGNLLETYADLSEATNWLDLGATNPYAMFDDIFQSQTISAVGTNIVVTIKQDDTNEEAPSLVTNAMAFFNLYAKEITIIGTNGYNETFNLVQHAQISTCKEMNCNFGRKIFKRTLVVNLPKSCQAVEYTVTIKPPKETKSAKCGILKYGSTIAMGITLKRANLTSLDYSLKEKNEWGGDFIVERPYSTRLTASIIMSTDAMSGVWEFLDDVRAKPLVWIPTENNRYRIFTTYGIITDKSISADDIGEGTCDQQMEITVEGLT